MTVIPAAWRTALGGTILSGNANSSIVSCQVSVGPALFAVDGDALVGQPAANTQIASVALSWYGDQNHDRLGHWNSNDPAQVIDGITVPSTTSSISYSP